MSLVAPAPRTWRRAPVIGNPGLRWTLYLGAVLYLVLALGSMNVNWARLAEGLSRGARFVLRGG